MKNLFKISTVQFVLVFNIAHADYSDSLIRLFPLENYNQETMNYIDKKSTLPLIKKEIIDAKVKNFKEHLYGDLSPWSETYVTSVLDQPPSKDIKTNEKELFDGFRSKCDQDQPKSFSENFRPYSCDWFDKKILLRLNLSQFDPQPKYRPEQRAITVDNTSVRSLPTNEPIYSDYKKAGGGYPFDSLQESAIWAGSPVYVVGYSNDKSWALILSGGHYMGWLPSTKIALVNDHMVALYKNTANKNGLQITTKTESVVYLSDINITPFTAYVGSVFPSGKVKNEKGNKDGFSQILIPVRKSNGEANFVLGKISSENSDTFPLSPTQQNFYRIIDELKGRNYGWGGLNFYNDCSQEVQSIFTTFGIWLPRNSVQQVQEGTIKDLSKLDTQGRIAKTAELGRNLLTLVYIRGHIMLYVGKFDFHNSQSVPFIYNNIWGLAPKDNSYRAVMGKSIFLPILTKYPEDLNLNSLADSDRRAVYQLSFLDHHDSLTKARKIPTIRSLIFGTDETK
jgi:hypothetical protein